MCHVKRKKENKPEAEPGLTRPDVLELNQVCDNWDKSNAFFAGRALTQESTFI